MPDVLSPLLQELMRVPASRAQTAVVLPGEFVPRQPATLSETGVAANVIEDIILKLLYVRRVAWGREISAQTCLSASQVAETMRLLKVEGLVAFRNSTSLSDYQYELTTQGYERAERAYACCAHYGAVPVPLQQFLDAVHQQSVRGQRVSPTRLRKALAGLVMDDPLFARLGQALIAAKALFLYGAPGNGKTSIAQRLCQAFGERIWIPRTLLVDDQIVRLYDPTLHTAVDSHDYPDVDERWIAIERPTVVAGGELSMSNLEFTLVGDTGVLEAPLQLKSSCGTLLIDDFGRQQMSTTELLNRWIVPLESGIDYLNLPNGKKIQVPFDQLLVFSTNLAPHDLIDEAFMRRIPYKVEAPDPSPDQFHALFLETARRWQIQCEPDLVRRLIDDYYLAGEHPMRFCHPRDLLAQVKSYCEFFDMPLQVTPAAIDAALSNYFVL